MKKIIATKKAVREYVRELMEISPGLGWQSTGDLSTAPVSVSAVVDPSAAVTDPGNLNFKPTNRAELKTALSALVSDVPDDKIADFYSTITDTAQNLNSEDEEEEDMSNDKNVEEAIRRAVKSFIKESKKDSHETLKEFWQSKMNEAKPKGFNPFASRAKQEKAAERVKNLPAPTNPDEVKPTVYPAGASARTQSGKPSEEIVSALRKTLQDMKFVDEKEKNMLETVSTENSLILAIQQIIGSPEVAEDAVQYSKIFNSAKNVLEKLSEQIKSISDSESDPKERQTLLKDLFKNVSKAADIPAAKLEKDAEVFGVNHDRSVVGSSVFESLFGEEFDQTPRSYFMDLGEKINQAFGITSAAQAQEGEGGKRTYVKKKETGGMSIKDIIARIKEEEGEEVKPGYLNQLIYVALGKLALGMKTYMVAAESPEESDDILLNLSDEDDAEESSAPAVPAPQAKPGLAKMSDVEKSIDGMVAAIKGGSENDLVDAFEDLLVSSKVYEDFGYESTDQDITEFLESDSYYDLLSPFLKFYNLNKGSKEATALKVKIKSLLGKTLGEVVPGLE